MSAKKMTGFILAMAVFGSVAAFAQQATKIGVINSQGAFEASAEGKKAAAQISTRTAAIKTEMDRMDAEIKQLETRLNTQRLTLTAEAGLQIQSDVDRKTTARKRYEEDAAREIQQLQSTLVEKIRMDMIAVVTAYAKENGFDLILDANAGVVFANPSIDITDAIVKKYDALPATPPIKK
ncbi:MAG: OmpH/Skp family outer membrane protein [Candidatus Aminicenantales bacterium]